MDLFNNKSIRKRPLQYTIKLVCEGMTLKDPAEIDNCLIFQNSEWMFPRKSTEKSLMSSQYSHWLRVWGKVHLSCYVYMWLKKSFSRYFNKVKVNCGWKGRPTLQDVERTNLHPYKHKKIFTVGVFDLLHKGHVELFRRAKNLGDYLIVAVQDGDFILKYKPNAKVVNSTTDRKYMTESIRYVDEVITYTDVDQIVKEISFDVFVTGPDQTHAGFKRAIKWCEEHGKEHIIIGRTEGVSSSELKEKISNAKNNDYV